MPVAAHPLSRRAALALAAGGAAVLTGCDVLDSTPEPAPTPDADTVLVDEAVTKITSTAALAADVPALAAMHAAHLAALEAGPTSSASLSTTPSPTSNPASTAAPATGPAVRVAERDLQRYLAAAALRAESGPLARLLASMSASVSQHLVALRRELR